MKINGINFNCNLKNNINFGRFLDKNAANVIKNRIFRHDDDFTHKIHAIEYNRIKNCQYCDVFTDKDGKVKAIFDNEYLKQSPTGDGYNLDEFYSVDIDRYDRDLSIGSFASTYQMT